MKSRTHPTYHYVHGRLKGTQKGSREPRKSFTQASHFTPSELAKRIGNEQLAGYNKNKWVFRNNDPQQLLKDTRTGIYFNGHSFEESPEYFEMDITKEAKERVFKKFILRVLFNNDIEAFNTHYPALKEGWSQPVFSHIQNLINSSSDQIKINNSVNLQSQYIVNITIDKEGIPHAKVIAYDFKIKDVSHDTIWNLPGDITSTLRLENNATLLTLTPSNALLEQCMFDNNITYPTKENPESHVLTDVSSAIQQENFKIKMLVDIFWENKSPEINNIIKDLSESLDNYANSTDSEIKSNYYSTRTLLMHLLMNDNNFILFELWNELATRWKNQNQYIKFKMNQLANLILNPLLEINHKKIIESLERPENKEFKTTDYIQSYIKLKKENKLSPLELYQTMRWIGTIIEKPETVLYWTIKELDSRKMQIDIIDKIILPRAIQNFEEKLAGTDLEANDLLVQLKHLANQFKANDDKNSSLIYLIQLIQCFTQLLDEPSCFEGNFMRIDLDCFTDPDQKIFNDFIMLVTTKALNSATDDYDKKFTKQFGPANKETNLSMAVEKIQETAKGDPKQASKNLARHTALLQTAKVLFEENPSAENLLNFDDQLRKVVYDDPEVFKDTIILFTSKTLSTFKNKLEASHLSPALKEKLAFYIEMETEAQTQLNDANPILKVNEELLKILSTLEKDEKAINFNSLDSLSKEIILLFKSIFELKNSKTPEDPTIKVVRYLKKNILSFVSNFDNDAYSYIQFLKGMAEFLKLNEEEILDIDPDKLTLIRNGIEKILPENNSLRNQFLKTIDQDKVYDREKEKLQSKINELPSSHLILKSGAMFVLEKAIEEEKQTEKIPSLTKAIRDTTTFLQDPFDYNKWDHYTESAKTLANKTWSKQIAGGMLMILGISILFASAAATVLTFGTAAPALVIGVAVASAGLGLATSAGGAQFLKDQPTEGAMNSLAETARQKRGFKQQIEYTDNAPSAAHSEDTVSSTRSHNTKP